MSKQIPLTTWTSSTVPRSSKELELAEGQELLSSDESSGMGGAMVCMSVSILFFCRKRKNNKKKKMIFRSKAFALVLKKKL